MTESEVSKSRRVTSGSKAPRVGRLFVLDLSGGRVFSLNADGSDQKIIVNECRHPDGIVVDVEAGHIYWTDMGVPNLNDDSIERADLDGQNRRMIVPVGGTFTPKQLHLDKKNGKLYWTDRGDPPRGNTVNRAPMDMEMKKKKRQAPEILLTHLQEGIDIALDLKEERMFLTDLGGSVYSAKLNGSDKKTLLYLQANLTGIAYAELPSSNLV